MTLGGGRPYGDRVSAVTALVLALAALVGWLVWVSLGWPLFFDAPLMHYVAWRIQDGAVPYRDVFDMNFPGVYLLHMAVLTVLGPGSAAWRAVDLALSAAIAALLFRLARPFGARAAATGALLFTAYHLSGGPGQEGQRDLFVFCFLLGATLGVARAIEADQRGSGPAFAAGLCLGIGVTIKPVAAVYALFMLGALAVAARRRARPWLGRVTALCGGAALPVVAITAWLVEKEALSAFLELVFSFVLPLYSRIGRHSVWRTLSPLHYAYLALVTALALGSIATAWRRGALGPRMALLGVGLAYGVLNYVAQGKGWSYHLIPWVGFACPLAASRLESASPRARVALVAGVAALSAATLAKGVEVVRAFAPQPGKATRIEGLVAALRPCAERGPTIQVFDTTAGGIHALLRLHIRQPTRFIYDFQFFFEPENPYVQKLRAEFMRDLRTNPPECVVVFEEAWPTGDYHRLESFAEFGNWLAEDYVLDLEQDGYRVYAQRDHSANHPGL